jgi:acyl carrier protein
MNCANSIREFILGGLVVFDEELTLNDDDDIFERGFVDSLFALELVSFVEKTFHIELGDDDLILSNFSTVNAVVSLVSRKQNGESVSG